MSALSLFSGVEGLGLAVAEVFGAHPVAFAEFDKHASKVLAARYPDVPNVGDVTAADWSAFDNVTVIHGGPPCQPFSAAGRRGGMTDDRWMWPAMARAVRMVRPRYVVVENVPPLVADNAWGVIVGDLAALGYMGSWTCLRASDVGACHRRERVFLLATDAGSGAGRPADGRDLLGRRAGDSEQAGLGGGHPAPDADLLATGWNGRAPSGAQEPAGRRQPHEGHGPRHGGATTADADRPEGRRTVRGGGDERAAGPGGVGALADANGSGRGPHEYDDAQGEPDSTGSRWADYAPAVARHAAVLGRPAPAPTDERGRLSARFVEWMQMFPEGWVTDVLPRNAALKALGNAVVPAQGAAALRLLLARMDRLVAA